MTSTSALSQFADLSPSQRQMLFEKLRKKKLEKARQPTQNESNTQSNPLAMTAYQAELVASLDGSRSLNNRLVELEVQGNLAQQSLQQSLNALVAIHPLLGAQFSPESNSFIPSNQDTPVSVQAITCAETEQAQTLEEVRAQLTVATTSLPVLQVSLLTHGSQQHRLLLAAYPLAIDAHSLLMLADCLLRLVNNQQAPIQQQPVYSFAQWSSNTLANAELVTEWARVAPKTKPGVAPSACQTHRHGEYLPESFFASYGAANQSTKTKILTTFQHCFSAWLAHQETVFWLADPSLKDSSFDNLVGYFPYYVPVKHEDANAQTDIRQVLTKLHTRYASVSEQLAQHMCQHGAEVPLIHYHWLDQVAGDPAPLCIQSVQQHSSGPSFSPLEIHITETSNGVNFDFLYDPEKLSAEQIKFLFRDFLNLLKADTGDQRRTNLGLADQLRDIWQELLQVESIPAGANFFELGGHSLQVTEMKFRIKQRLKLDMAIAVIYELPTIEELCSFIVATHGDQLGLSQLNADQSECEEELEEGTL